MNINQLYMYENLKYYLFNLIFNVIYMFLHRTLELQAAFLFIIYQPPISSLILGSSYLPND